MTGQPRRVFAVSSGEYSDYSVHALFTTRLCADEAVTIGDRLFVEEFDLYDVVPMVWVREASTVISLHTGEVLTSDDDTAERLEWETSRHLYFIWQDFKALSMGIRCAGSPDDAGLWKRYGDARAKAIALAPQILAEVRLAVERDESRGVVVGLGRDTAGVLQRYFGKDVIR